MSEAKMPEDKKHFDVAKAGQIPVSHTSRPVIVGQKDAPASDPMMRTSDSEQSPATSDHRVSLQPLHPDTKSEVADTKPATTETPTNEVKSREATQQAPLLAPADNPEIQQLITDKTYKLPIKTPASRTFGLLVVIVVIIGLLVAVILYFMMNR